MVGVQLRWNPLSGTGGVQFLRNPLLLGRIVFILKGEEEGTEPTPLLRRQLANADLNFSQVHA
jgi:hypothetical protein